MAGKLRLKMPLVVEGRYDKSALSGYIDGVIITTGGFSIFNNKEKQALIRRAATDGIIVLTDSDGGGRQIRSFLSGILPPESIHHVFIPKIEGKEKRKRAPGKAGVIGVEGMKPEVILKILSPFICDDISANDLSAVSKKEITKVDFYKDGLSGTDGASERRALLCKAASLPEDMTAKALLEAMNLLYGYDEYKKLLNELD